MKTGIELISLERWEHIFKHGRTIENDIENNTSGQLTLAASILALHENQYGYNEVEDFIVNLCPDGWDSGIWERMLRKPHKERLIIAGSLCAAAIDIYVYSEKFDRIPVDDEQPNN